MADASAESPILRTLNAAQRRAVTSPSSTLAILAGPGSGKTHTLTSRVVWLVDTVGYRPEDVLVATFTVKAAREMKERIGRALGHGRERKIVLGTFHSVARRYLAAYGGRIGLNQKFGIADDSDSRAIVSRICKRLQLGVDPALARAWISKKKAKGTITEQPSKRPPKNGGKQPESTKDLEACYEEYQNHLQRSNLLDYDDLLVKCVDLLQRFPSCVSNVQSVLIDEYQDTNGVQFELMKLFAQARRRITVVGDPDQSIYGWRSAEIRNLYRFLREFPGTEEVSLEENYRSAQSILDVSLKVIQQDQKRYQKALLPTHSRGTRPVLRKLKTSALEAEWVVSEIRRLVMMTGDMVTHDDVAILLRSASLSRHIESALGKSGIPYRMVGGFKFYERAEIKIILDYLRVIHQPENNDALARILNVPRRGIGDGTIKSLVEEAERASLSLWALLVKHCRGDRLVKTSIKKQAEQKISGELIRLIKGTRDRMDAAASSATMTTTAAAATTAATAATTTPTPLTLVEMIENLLAQLKFQKFLEDSHAEDHETRWANVQEFIGLAGDFARELEQAGDDDNLPEVEGVEQTRETDVLAKFLANVSLASDAGKDSGDDSNKPVVTISTIHAAKGLEWPIVFVPSAYNGSIPHMRSEDTDEERRLLYVAMTRAKALLYLSCPLYSSQGSGETLELSPFLSPISSAYFAKRGPSFEKQALTEIGRILGREVPSDSKRYGSMPLSARQEDDLFPIDPEQNQNLPDAAGKSGSYPGGGPQPKRRRVHSAAGPSENEEAAEWHRGYETTMEGSSSFTVSSLPGFTSAGAHHSTLAATASRDARPGPTSEGGGGGRGGGSKRPLPNQATLHGFVRTMSNPEPGPHALGPRDRTAGTGHGAAAARGRPSDRLHPVLWKGNNVPTPAPPAIEPTLANHKLRGTGSMAHPARRKQADETARRQYSHFSSSPPRPSMRGEDAPPAGNEEKGAAGLEKAETGGEEPAPAPAREQTRPVATFHNTTCGKRLGGGLPRGGLAPMDKLRKPFKPLTMNRPQRPVPKVDGK